MDDLISTPNFCKTKFGPQKMIEKQHSFYIISNHINVRSSCGYINESVKISSGIGEGILKEEWR